MASVAWNMGQNGAPMYINSNCVAVDSNGNVLLEESVYYDNLQNTNRSLLHLGDNRTGDREGDDEIITIDLAHIPASTVAFYFVLTISEGTWAHVQLARIRFLADDTGFGICQMVPSDLIGPNNPYTALFLV